MMRAFAVVVLLAILGLLVLLYPILLRLSDPSVSLRRIPDSEQGSVCYVTSRGGISCLPDFPHRAIAAIHEPKTE